MRADHVAVEAQLDMSPDQLFGYTGLAAAAQRFRTEPTAITHHEGRRPLFANSARARSTPYNQPARTGHRSKAVGPVPGGTRRQTWEEEAVVAVARKLVLAPV